MPYKSIVISSGHGLKIRGASGVIDEVDEARRTVDRVAEELRSRDVEVKTFHDNTSTTQDKNLATIVNYHNAQERELDVSLHFNAYQACDKPMGTEVLYVTQYDLAYKLSKAIAKAGGFIDRGPKKNTGLYVLNNCDMPTVLLEICFVDSEADCKLYEDHFDAICSAIADTLGGPLGNLDTDTPPKPAEPATPGNGRVDLEVSGNVIVTVNGTVINT